MSQRPNPLTDHLVNIDRQRSGEYLLRVFSLTQNGLSVLDGLPARVPAGAEAIILGTEVLAALNKSRIGLPPYVRGDDLSGPFLKFVGAKSNAAYVRGVHCVGVSANFVDSINDFRVQPEANGGGKEGFSPIVEHIRHLPFQSPEQLGQAVLDAFEYAT
jgi:hypothetical protein